DAGDSLSIGAASSGVVSYLGLRGGFEVAPVLGSLSRDSLAKVGPEPLVTGARLQARHRPRRPVEPGPAPRPLPQAGDVVTLDIHLGPRDDWFTDRGLAVLTTQDWQVTTEISRTGKRLAGDRPLERSD